MAALAGILSLLAGLVLLTTLLATLSGILLLLPWLPIVLVLLAALVWIVHFFNAFLFE
ncbi:MAG: hypothetical protein WBE14_06305 [Xanthobacteraceae bacterium]